MPRTPNYGFERKERDRIKAAKKAEKLAAKAEKRNNESTDVLDQKCDQPEVKD